MKRGSESAQRPIARQGTTETANARAVGTIIRTPVLSIDDCLCRSRYRDRLKPSNAGDVGQLLTRQHHRDRSSGFANAHWLAAARLGYASQVQPLCVLAIQLVGEQLE